MKIIGTTFKILFWVIIILFIIFEFLNLQNNCIKIKSYDVYIDDLPKDFESYSIVLISDLHSKKFNNNQLVKKIDKVSPDIILAAGDMIDSSDLQGENYIDLVKVIAEKYTIVYSLGNHEQSIKYSYNNSFNSYIEKVVNEGAIYLNNEVISVQKGRGTLNIYALVPPLYYYTSPKDANYKESYSSINVSEYIELKSSENVNILISHHPKFLNDYRSWGADLVVSGHIHGGVIRIPFVGGLLSPDREFFPDYDYGRYKIDGCEMIISSGLGNSMINQRIFNRPEIVEIVLKKAVK